MEEFDLKSGLKKYVKEAQFVIPMLSLSVLGIFVCFLWLNIVWMGGGEVTLPFVFMGVFALSTVLLFLRYKKNSKNYYFFCYVDAFPDMDAPLNVMIYADFRGSLAERASEYGLKDVSSEFLRTRQVYHLDVRATAPNGNFMSVRFETDKLTVYDLAKGTNVEKKYDEILVDKSNPVGTIGDLFLFVVAYSQAD